MPLDMIKFDLPKNQSSIIKVIGVGGGGGNAVNHMYNQGIKGVDFIICNTDSQALEKSPIPNKVQLGISLTEGLGAGADPVVGQNSAIENIEQIRAILEKNTKMAFITAGMGGGTGTGAAPVIAQVARELGILTIGIVTLPFNFEGRKRSLQAKEGIEELKKHVDSLIVICNDRLFDCYGELPLTEAFEKADDVLTIGAKGIAEIISKEGIVNVDLNDVKAVMKNSGVAIMGAGSAEGENRAVKAISAALNSPLLNDNDICGAKNILLNIYSGQPQATTVEIRQITDFINDEAGNNADIIWGFGIDETLGSKIHVTVVATGLNTAETVTERNNYTAQNKKIVLNLDNQEKPKEEVIAPKQNDLNNFQIIDKSITNEVKQNEVNNTVASNNNEIKFINTNNNLSNLGNGNNSSNNNNSVVITKQITLSLDDNINNNDNKFDNTEKTIEKKIDTNDNSNLTTKDNSLLIDRTKILKDLSLKVKKPNTIEEFENQPAYLRKGVVLNDVTPSSESQVSRLTLSDTDDKKAEIKSNNSFLHDNVD